MAASRRWLLLVTGEAFVEGLAVDAQHGGDNIA
jgi:hypothetical protein